MLLISLVRPLSSSLMRQQQLSRIPACLMNTQPRVALVQGQTTANKEFWSKNQELNRPLSPHLTIYKFPLPAVLSIGHRITGIGATIPIYVAGIGALFCNQSFPDLLQTIQSVVPHSLILATKTALGGAIIYHSLNGVRHLIWDVGYGLQLKHIYISGYFILALTALGTAGVFIYSS